MSAFENFLTTANKQAASIMGESITINGETVNATFDEQVNEWDMREQGELSDPTVTLVIALADITTVPKKSQRFVRNANTETFFITEVKISTGNVELTARNETKTDG